MQAHDIAGRIATLIGEQADAIAGSDFDRLEALTTETTELLQALDASATELGPEGRADIAAMLQPAATQANALVEATSTSLGETRHELQELRHGQSATSAYRQAVPKTAAIGYSRQG